ncbi:MAG: helix-turn-helix domain-containing protein [Firmicutes bacterium]|nr:helix-turn-helix domain-containing protein [Bacillota bacterium]
MTETYLTLKQAAASCGVTYAALRREIEKGRLPACRVGRKYFVSAAAAAEWRAARQTPAGNCYTVRQVMEILPLSYAFLIELIRKGELAAVKQGRRYLISESELERFIAASACAGDQTRP